MIVIIASFAGKNDVFVEYLRYQSRFERLHIVNWNWRMLCSVEGARILAVLDFEGLVVHCYQLIAVLLNETEKSTSYCPLFIFYASWDLKWDQFGWLQKQCVGCMCGWVGLVGSVVEVGSIGWALQFQWSGWGHKLVGRVVVIDEVNIRWIGLGS